MQTLMKSWIWCVAIIENLQHNLNSSSGEKKIVISDVPVEVITWVLQWESQEKKD